MSPSPSISTMAKKLATEKDKEERVRFQEQGREREAVNAENKT